MSTRYKELQCIRVNDILVEAFTSFRAEFKMNANLARATFSFPDGRDLERTRARLSKIEGIRSVGVSILTQMVYVEYDPQEITIEKIRTALRHPR